MKLLSLLAVALTVTLTACLSTAWALPANSPKLEASLAPERLGHSTTITMGFQIPAQSGALPKPLLEADLRLPTGLIGGSDTLGLATCSSMVLTEEGLAGCSPNALMGQGEAVVGVPFGPGVLYEQVSLAIVMGSLTDGHTTLWFYAEGASPVIAQLVFPGILLDDLGPFGTRLQTTIPIIPGLPGDAPAALVSMKISIGPKGLTYYKRVGGKTVAFVPEGFAVPGRCPRGGFPFAAQFRFTDGSRQAATSAVPCPPRRLHRSR